MTINEQVINDLNRAVRDGKPWVAFNDRADKELNPYAIHVFASAAEAERFCDEANGTFDFAGQVFNFDNYIYMQAATLKASLQMEEQLISPIAIDAPAIARRMAEQSLYLPAGKSIDDLEASLSRGLFYPVFWHRFIDPLKEIAEYHVVGHQHYGGQVYETGHSHRVLASFGSLGEARTFMDSVVLYNELAGKGTDYLVIGRFHGRPLELDLEGYAAPHSGLTLVTAHHNYNHGHNYHELHSLPEQATISRYFFVGIKDGELRLYNDKLEPTTIGIIQQPFYPTHFINDYLTIKNSSIMNEQSFDYVKNQLFYLGFGEEIAKPLRVKMEQNLTEFTLPHTRKFGQDETSSVLHFSKGDQKDKDMTFFNRVDVTLKQAGKEDLTQSFFIGKEYNYTLQERYNMMDGRFAYREQPKMEKVEENGETKMKPTGETYFGWKGLNFKETDKYGNFMPKTMFWKHEREFYKYPIKELAEPYDAKRIIASMQKGNKANVTILKDGEEIKGQIAANPRMQRFDFYDAGGQSIKVEQVKKQRLDKTEEMKQSETKEMKQETKETRQQQVASEQNKDIKQGKKQGLRVA